MQIISYIILLFKTLLKLEIFFNIYIFFSFFLINKSLKYFSVFDLININ